jgi:hypothetical protein
MWEPAGVLMLAVGLLAFGSGATLGLSGVVISPLVVGVIGIWAELERHPLSAHRFAVSGSLGVASVVVLGLAGYAARLMIRWLGESRRKASRAAAVDAP